MSLASTPFIFLFAPAAIVIYWLIPQRLRHIWLLAASYAFYTLWSVWFPLILLAITVSDFYIAGQITVAQSAGRKKHLVAAGVVISLGALVFFKYAGFLAQTVNAVAGLLGDSSPLSVPALLLPVGISFYSFQSISYILDVAKGRTAPAKSFVAYAAWTAMFPKLIAGPIARYGAQKAEFENPPAALTAGNLSTGLTFFAAGLVKKVLVADQLAYFVNPLWSDFSHLSMAEAWCAVVGYSLQIYFDFAGYSLMAIGIGHLLGLKLPQNFNSPYRAKDIADFWRRWHMTLSFWLRDYLFFALGGMRLNLRYVALFLTMVLCGLWHGAAWTFVVWGAWHGAILLVHHFLREKKLRWRGRWPGVAGTFVLVSVGWVFFRSESLGEAWAVFGRLFGASGMSHPSFIPAGFYAVAVPALLWAIFGPNAYEFVHTKGLFPRKAALVILGILAAVSVLLLSATNPFLYGQF